MSCRKQGEAETTLLPGLWAAALLGYCSQSQDGLQEMRTWDIPA